MGFVWCKRSAAFTYLPVVNILGNYRLRTFSILRSYVPSVIQDLGFQIRRGSRGWCVYSGSSGCSLCVCVLRSPILCLSSSNYSVDDLNPHENTSALYTRRFYRGNDAGGVPNLSLERVQSAGSSWVFPSDDGQCFDRGSPSWLFVSSVDCRLYPRVFGGRAPGLVERALNRRILFRIVGFHCCPGDY